MIKVILPASEIPLYSKITKINGQKVYTIRDKIEIYGPTPQTITSDKNSRFIISEDGNISVVGGNSELVWLAEYYDLFNYIETPQ